MKQKFYIGTYTEPIRFGTGEILIGKGKGIYFSELNDDGKLIVKDQVTKAANPSFLAVSSDGAYLCAVNELKEYNGEESGCISIFHIEDMEGRLMLTDMKPTHGQDPCHVAFCKNKKIVVSNFMSGSICSYEVDRNGKLKEGSFIQHQGSSIHPIRQKGPHAHSCICIPETDKILIPDLGMDYLMVYEWKNDGSLKFCEEESYKCIPGSGPRFGEFSRKKDLLYVINELSSEIMVLQYHRNTGKMSSIQQISTLLNPCENICADLHITADGRFLYASNRGHDSITGFAVNDNGKLDWLFNISCGGKTPRNFAIEPEGRYLLVGNQDSDEIVIFSINSQDGSLREVSRTKVPTPVCICSVR